MAFGRGSDKRGTPADLLVLGLGNPGSQYERSRHNVGADTVMALAVRHGERLRSTKERSFAAELRVGGKRLVVAFPQTFYNESGAAAAALIRRHGITDPSGLLVVHDEMDLDCGVLKVKVGGGLAGNNGLRSIKAHMGTQDFLRIRIGIGKPPAPGAGKNFVLGKPKGKERAELDNVIEKASDAVEIVLAEGPERAMNQFN